jgi:hypothetical protein
MRTARTALAAATLAVLGVLGTGCSGGGVPVVPPVAATPPAAPAAVPARSTPPAPPPGPTETGTPRCTTGELSAALGEGDAGAGSVYRPLVFTNTGPRTCALRGFPGVSYVAGDDGHQVGPAAEMSGERGDQVPIAPGATAVAPLQLVNVQNFDPAVCRPQLVRGLRVYPPGDTASLFVPMEGTGCAGTPPGAQLSVRTVQAP